LLLFVYTQFIPGLRIKISRYFAYFLLIISLPFSLYAVQSVRSLRYAHFTPLAAFVLDRFPSFYDPYPYTFICRTLHKDGGYWMIEKEPVIYANLNGQLRKILISSEMESPEVPFRHSIIGDQQEIAEIAKRINNAARTIPPTASDAQINELEQKLRDARKSKDWNAELMAWTNRVLGQKFTYVDIPSNYKIYLKRE
jgi:hypothetical protein